MFIFRIIINLIGLLTRTAVRLLTLPISIILRHPLAVIVVVFALLLLIKCSNEPKPERLPQAEQSVPAPAEPPQTQRRRGKQQQPPLIEPVLKREDGDSKFATDLYAAMTDEERAYYSHIYFWAMNSLPDGQGYSWANANINGTITPLSTFQNKLGDRCRQFTELLKVHTVEQTLTGTACENGGGSWCKLKPNATPACNLGYNPGFFESLFAPLRRIF